MAQSSLGSRGEAIAAEDLQRKGYTVLTCNYKLPCGEIDIIARNSTLLIFVEVKTRTKNYFDAAELITPAKQRRIIKTAQHYLIKNKFTQLNCRFDVALISWQSTHPTITYLEDAFNGELT